MAEQALSGIKILDLTHYIAGPFCTKLLADYGADVLKIEKPEKGDEARYCGPFRKEQPDLEGSGLFIFLNTNKRGITLDLKTASGVDLFKNLVKDADVVVENFKPSVLAHLGLDYLTLKQINPRLVMTSISNFGQTGPYKDYRATELISVAMGGLLSTLGERDREPIKPGGSQAQFHAGIVGAISTLSAVIFARLAGIGQHVDVSIMEADMSMVQLYIMDYPYSGQMIQRTGPLLGYYPWGVYAAKDGYISIGTHQVQWKRAGPWIGRPELADDPRLELPSERLKHFEELDAIFLPWFLERTKEEIVSSGQANRIPVTPVNTPEDMLTDPQYKAREFFVEVPHPHMGKIVCPGAPFKMNKTPWQVHRPAPLLGESNEEIYSHHTNLTQKKLHNLTQGINAPGDELSMPLSHIRIVDLTLNMAGPMATLCLADLGAEVIKIESIQRMDDQRGIKRPPKGIIRYPDKDPGERPWNRNTHFNQLNRNKLGITLDITRPEGKKLLLDLVKIADVVVDNYAARVMSKFGLNNELLRSIKPNIIVMSMPGFGQTGPFKGYAGWGPQFESVSGLTAVTGYPDLPPIPPLTSDPVAGLMGAFALLAALYYRDQTGQGQFIDFSHAEAHGVMVAEFILDYTINGKRSQRMGNRHSSMAPHGVYQCKGDDDWVAIAISSDQEWRSFCRVLGNSLWTEAQNFSSLEGRHRNQDELDSHVTEWTRERTNYEVMHILQSAGVPAGVVLNLKTVFDDPHLQARGVFEKVTHPDAGIHLYPGPFWKMSETQPHIRTPAPCLGQHNTYVLRELLGLSPWEINELESKNIIGTVPLD